MLEFFKGLFGRGSAEEKPDNVGSNADPIRRMLFASQSALLGIYARPDAGRKLRRRAPLIQPAVSR